ncbi:hypothetical protein MYX65_07845 [Acidobacteria bacterium AH-259-L09]|nr:hypothetical protein [Acidobacteria bacterium AH-259-L09]
MLRLNTVARVSFGLGVLSLLAVVTSHLALTDIYHGETDVGLEWRVLQICFVVIVVFQLSALYTLRRILRGTRGHAPSTTP